MIRRITLLVVTLVLIVSCSGGSETKTAEVATSVPAPATPVVPSAAGPTASPTGTATVPTPTPARAPEPLSVNVKPSPCASPEIGISDTWISTLKSVNFTKCVRPFGVLIAADERVPDIYIAQAAKIAAEILDPDMDGTANDPRVAKLVSDYETAWIPMPTDMNSWHEGDVENKLGETLDSYGIALPRWWMLGDEDFGNSSPDKRAKAVMVEEIVHFMTQFGYSRAYPQIFGVEDWGSVIAEETKRASCDWWQHPENDCPGKPGHEGDCSMSNCDVTEFYHQVLVTMAGMTPGWIGIGFPNSLEELEGKLSPALKRVMADPRYNQLNKPLTFSYPFTLIDSLRPIPAKTDAIQPLITSSVAV